MNIFNKIKNAVDLNQDVTSFCINLSKEEIIFIYDKCVLHGIFDEKNYGFHDIKNSVYGYVSSIFELNSK
jgi:hypothetical protein